MNQLDDNSLQYVNQRGQLKERVSVSVSLTRRNRSVFRSQTLQLCKIATLRRCGHEDFSQKITFCEQLDFKLSRCPRLSQPLVVSHRLQILFKKDVTTVGLAAEMSEDDVSSDTVRLRTDLVLLFKHCIKCSCCFSVLATYCAVKKAATSSLFSS